MSDAKLQQPHPPQPAAGPVPADAAFQLRGSSFTVMVLRIQDADANRLFPQLEDKLGQAPNFFRNAPVVLDLDAVAGDRALNLASLVRRLRTMALIPVGLQGGTPTLRDAALAVGLPVMPGGRPARAEGADGAAPAPAPSGTAAAAAAPAPAARVTESARVPTLYVTEPVRSGRQIYAANGSLVVLAPVSPGAEVLADGDIHIYGPLRGRALAGITGDASARIFCQSLDAELVSVAGLYRVNEDLDTGLIRRPTQIYLSDGYLRMSPL